MVMTMVLPILNFSLFVEITTNIGDHVFMTISSVNASTIGNAINMDIPSAKINPYSSQGNGDIDQFTVDFGHITVSVLVLNFYF